jgi:hypothetical protein
MKRAFHSVVIALCLVVFGSRAAADGKKLVVVVARGSAVNNLSRADLKRCFLSEPVTAGGSTLIPFNAAPGTPTRMGFDQAVLGMSPEQVGRYWVDRKIRGQSGAPRSLPSAAHVAKVAAKFPHAISYLPEDQLTSDIQAVAIDGVAYTDPSYDIVSR